MRSTLIAGMVCSVRKDGISSVWVGAKNIYSTDYEQFVAQSIKLMGRSIVESIDCAGLKQ